MYLFTTLAQLRYVAEILFVFLLDSYLRFYVQLKWYKRNNQIITKTFWISRNICYIFSLSIAVVVVVVIEEFNDFSSVEFSSPFMAESES